MTLLLTEADVRSLLTMPIALEVVEESLRQQGNGELVLHPRRRIKLQDNSLLNYMAAGDSVRGYIGMKLYTVVRGVARFVVPLFRSTTGEMAALIEADALGQLRTGAATGVALIAVDEGGQNTIIVAPGANGKVTRADVDAARPAWAAARGLAPTTRNLRPKAVRVMSRCTSRTAAIAIRMPLLTVVPNKRGNRSATGKTGVCGTSVVGSRKGILTSTLTRLVPRKLIINEVMISLMP